jgi:copper ion binding protein
MSQSTTFSVPGVSCGHCRAAISDEVGQLDGVTTVEVDVERKLVRVTGEQLDGAAIVAAIDDAGYEAVAA